MIVMRGTRMHSVMTDALLLATSRTEDKTTDVEIYEVANDVYVD